MTARTLLLGAGLFVCASAVQVECAFRSPFECLATMSEAAIPVLRRVAIGVMELGCGRLATLIRLSRAHRAWLRLMRTLRG